MDVSTMILIVNVIVLFIVVLCAISGFKKGFILSMFDLLGMLIGFFTALFVTPFVAEAVTLLSPGDGATFTTAFVFSVINVILWFIIIFIAVVIIVAIVGKLVDKLFKLPVLNGLNKGLGILFGAIMSIFWIMILAIIVSSPLIPESDEVFEGSVLAPIRDFSDSMFIMVIEQAEESGVFDEYIQEFENEQNEKITIEDLINNLIDSTY